MKVPINNFRFIVFAALLVFAGCLPSSCGREPSRAVFPSDSLSRRVAATVPMDTLRMVWRADSARAAPLKTPMAVQFGADTTGRLYVADAGRDAVFAFAESGLYAGALGAGRLEAPRLAGTRGDSVLVLAPERGRIYFAAGGRLADSLDLPIDLPAENSKVWAAATAKAIFVKAATNEETGVYIARLSRRGAVEARRMLPPPAWRRAGPLHVWDGRLASFSRYRPEVLLLPFDLAAPADTLDLVGFDSPMLARSRSFILGEVGTPPVLIEGAAPAGKWLFVLNLRPGWLRIDVFDRDGRLVHRLTQADPSYNRTYYPRDLAVRRRPDGSYDIAVVFTHPEPVVTLYRWKPVAGTANRGPRTAARRLKEGERGSG